MDRQLHINEFGNQLLDLIEDNAGNLPPYEIGHILINQAISLLLTTAPNERVAWKTILTSIMEGVKTQEDLENGA